jgi:hypothetical protein
MVSRLAAIKTAITAPIPLLRNNRVLEIRIIMILEAWASSYLGNRPLSLFCLVLELAAVIPRDYPQNKKSHRRSRSGGGILELLVMILEDLAPGARRRRHTAGTTEASLLGLLDVGNHRVRVQNGRTKVNEVIGRGSGLFRDRLLYGAQWRMGGTPGTVLRQGNRLRLLSKVTHGLLHRRGQNHRRCP